MDFDVTHLATETILVHISRGIEIRDRQRHFCGVLQDSHEELCHHDNFIARKVVFLDRATKHFLGEAVGVTLNAISRPCALLGQGHTLAVSKVLIPAS